MSFSLFLAARYLRPKRTFLSVITLISVLGVTLGVMVLILVISVMSGFDRELRRKVLAFDAHLIITSETIINDWRELLDQGALDPEVTGGAPFVLGPVIVEYAQRRLAPKIRGVDPALEESVSEIQDFIIAGEFNLDGDNTVLGADLARSLGINVGDELTIYSPGNLSAIVEEMETLQAGGDASSEDRLKSLVLPSTLTVTGIFQSGRYLYDSEFVVVPLYIGQELYSLGDGVHGVTFRTRDPYKIDLVKNRFYDFLGPETTVSTWIDMNRQLFDAIRMERSMMFFLLLFIIVVAAFGIMNTLITVTVQKTRDIGIMKAIGARTSQIVWVFLAQGMVVGFFGTLTGLLSGISIVHWRNEVSDWLSIVLGREVFPREIYEFSSIPAEVVVSDVAIICVSAFVICTLAAWVPAFIAARLDPVKALRIE